MKFFYENNPELYKNPNGFNDECILSNFDFEYGIKNKIFYLSDNGQINWMFNSNSKELNIMFNNSIEYFHKIFNTVRNKPNIRLVFCNTYEGKDIYIFIKQLILFKNKYDLKKYQIIVITINEISNIFSNEITIICKPYMLEFFAIRCQKLLENVSYNNQEILTLSSTYDYLNTKKEKFFLSYNKNCNRYHRTELILWLLKNNLIDNTLLSILIKPSHIIKSNYDNKYEQLYGLNDNFSDYLKLGYKILDFDCNDKNSIFSDQIYSTRSHYDKTLFNIVTETTFDNNSLNYTEKSFKPISNCHPFLIIGDKGINQGLKKYGFSIYDDLIDYSFDSITDNYERLNSIFREIKRIYNLGEEHIIEWYKNNISKIEYNKDIFLDYTKSNFIKKTIKEMKMKKVLITGSSGLVGTHLIKKCMIEGYDIIGVDIVDPIENIIDYNYHNFKFIKMDLTKDENIINLFKFNDFDAVFNCFGIKGSPLRAKNHPVDFLYPSFKINTEIINQCANKNIWLIFVSSVGVYAPAEKFIEDTVWKTLPGKSDWFPSWSKRMGEILLEAYKVQQSYNNWAIIRPANIFGEYDDFSGNGTVIASTIKKIVESEDEILCWGDGSSIRDFVYAGDVADAIIKLYQDQTNITINFGSGEEITIKQIIEKLVKISGKNLNIQWDSSKPNGDLRRQMDITKQTEYSLLPKLGIDKSLEITYNYYKNTIIQ